MFKKRFQSKEIGETITAGDCLRRGREEAGLSLRQVSGELGIKEDYLENLENGNYHELPPQVYVRGFIKSYASFLRIDASQLIKIYNREMAYLGEDDRLRRQERCR
jgi:cytoskeletal protein RodZ